jgi:hypothetical protein
MMRTVVFAMLFALSACVHGGEMTNESKTVLALQCFLGRQDEQRIVDAWERVSGIEGVQCAHTLGAVPHITAGSWKVTPDELEQARTGLAAKVAGICAIETDVMLHEERRDGILSYYLVPTGSTALVIFHKEVHEALGYPYETFRTIDLPGRWWPHLTLFSVPEERLQLVADALEKLKQIERVSIERLGLVTFGPIEVIAEAGLASAEEAAPSTRQK